MSLLSDWSKRTLPFLLSPAMYVHDINSTTLLYNNTQKPPRKYPERLWKIFLNCTSETQFRLTFWELEAIEISGFRIVNVSSGFVIEKYSLLQTSSIYLNSTSFSFFYGTIRLISFTSIPINWYKRASCWNKGNLYQRYEGNTLSLFTICYVFFFRK